MRRLGNDGGLVHVLDHDDRPACDDQADELSPLPTSTTWPPAPGSGIACPACEQIATSTGW